MASRPRSYCSGAPGILLPALRTGAAGDRADEARQESRIVQTLNIVPVSNEIVEETDIVETFKQQIAEGLYKIWPTKPLEPGEYAVVEYTEGKGNIQVWDFAVARSN